MLKYFSWNHSVWDGNQTIGKQEMNSFKLMYGLFIYDRTEKKEHMYLTPGASRNELANGFPIQYLRFIRGVNEHL